MPRIKLTETTIKKLKAPHPDGKQTPYWDTELTGFGVLVSGKTATKSYIVQRDLPSGVTRRVTIAQTNVIELDGKEGAREQAKAILAEMYKGHDPKAGRRGSANATLKDVLDDYLVARKDLREKSRTDYRKSIEGALAGWLDRPLRDITPDMVKARHAAIQAEVETRAVEDRKRREAVAPAKQLLAAVEDAPTPLVRALRTALKSGELAAIRSKAAALSRATNIELVAPPTVTIAYSGHASANGAMRAMRVLWNFQAERVSGMPPNPVPSLKRQWFPVPRRERFVRSEELPAFYKAVTALPNRTHSDYLLLLLFTGLRRSEAAGLKWDDVDLVDKVIRVPGGRTKSGRRLDMPMSDFVHDLLVARRALGKDGDYVFPSDSEAGYLAEPKFPLRQVAEASGVRVSPHDLRRSFITAAEATDISPLALKGLVNHSLGNDVTSGYVQMTAERLREPAQRVTDRLKALCGVAPRKGAARLGRHA